MKTKVWNIETGEERTVEGVDAGEYVKSGGWAKTQPVPVPELEPIEEPKEKKRK